MSAADRMVVRTLDGAYRSVPRRQGLGMIAAGRAQHAPATFEVGDEITTTSYVEEQMTPAPDSEPEHVDVEPLKTVDIEITTTQEMAELIGLTPSEPTPEPRGNASRAEWAVYARRIGVEVSGEMTRNQIRDAAQDAAQSLARLPQPALPGGRLETPEDEPVTEGSVTDDEDPGTR